MELGADPTLVPDVVQAVDESVTNIIEHGYRGRPGIVEVEVREDRRDTWSSGSATTPRRSTRPVCRRPT